MNRFYQLLIIICCLSRCLALKAQPVDTLMIHKLDEYLTSALNASKFNGTVLVAQNGKVILEKGYGWKEFSPRTVNNINSIYKIGSLTKSFTAMVILKLQEEGRISVDDKLTKYFPEQKKWERITIQNLLDHTSGLNNYTDVIGPEDSATVSHPVSKQKILDIFINKPLQFKPGSRFEYCNSGYFLLGMIIEKITGLAYEQAVRQIIFNPLKMAHSGFDYISLKDTGKTLGYVTIDKQTDRYLTAVKWDSTITYAAGGIYSNTGDLYKWAKAIAHKQILSTASWEQAFTPHLDNYGYGWWINKMFGQTYITHSGGQPGFMSNFVYFPDQDLAIILLSNFGNYSDSLVPINITLAAIMFNKPYRLWQSNTPIFLEDKVLQLYTGTYTADGKVKLFVTLKDGVLYVESSSKQGIPRTPIYPKSDTAFFFKDYNVIFSFVRGADGTGTSLISHEEGKDIEFKKVK